MNIESLKNLIKIRHISGVGYKDGMPPSYFSCYLLDNFLSEEVEHKKTIFYIEAERPLGKVYNRVITKLVPIDNAIWFEHNDGMQIPVGCITNSSQEVYAEVILDSRFFYYESHHYVVIRFGEYNEYWFEFEFFDKAIDFYNDTYYVDADKIELMLNNHNKKERENKMFLKVLFKNKSVKDHSTFDTNNLNLLLEILGSNIMQSIDLPNREEQINFPNKVYVGDLVEDLLRVSPSIRSRFEKDFDCTFHRLESCFLDLLKRTSFWSDTLGRTDGPPEIFIRDNQLAFLLDCILKLADPNSFVFNSHSIHPAKNVTTASFTAAFQFSDYYPI